MATPSPNDGPPILFQQTEGCADLHETPRHRLFFPHPTGRRPTSIFAGDCRFSRGCGAESSSTRPCRPGVADRASLSPPSPRPCRPSPAAPNPPAHPRSAPAPTAGHPRSPAPGDAAPADSPSLPSSHHEARRHPGSPCRAPAAPRTHTPETAPPASCHSTYTVLVQGSFAPGRRSKNSTFTFTPRA